MLDVLRGGNYYPRRGADPSFFFFFLYLMLQQGVLRLQSGSQRSRGRPAHSRLKRSDSALAGDSPVSCFIEKRGRYLSVRAHPHRIYTHTDTCTTLKLQHCPILSNPESEIKSRRRGFPPVTSGISSDHISINLSFTQQPQSLHSGHCWAQDVTQRLK